MRSLLLGIQSEKSEWIVGALELLELRLGW